MKNALIIGAGGIGKGFAQNLVTRGYRLHIQYRDTAKLPSIETEFPGEQYFQSDLQNKAVLENAFATLKESGVVPDVIILAAGASKLDNAFTDEEASTAFHREANYLTKHRVVEATQKIYGSALTGTHIFIISSHITDADDADIKNWKEIGYVTAMREVNTWAENLQRELPDVHIHLLKTLRVETQLLANLRKDVKADSNDTIDQGESPRDYAEKELQKAGL